MTVLPVPLITLSRHRAALLVAGIIATTAVLMWSQDSRLLPVLLAYASEEPARFALGILWAMTTAPVILMPAWKMHAQRDLVQWYWLLIAAMLVLVAMLIGSLHLIHTVRQLPGSSAMTGVLCSLAGGWAVLLVVTMATMIVAMVDGVLRASLFAMHRRVAARQCFREFAAYGEPWIINGGLRNEEERERMIERLRDVARDLWLFKPSVGQNSALHRIRQEMEQPTPDSETKLRLLFAELHHVARIGWWHRIESTVDSALPRPGQSSVSAPVRLTKALNSWSELMVAIRAFCLKAAPLIVFIGSGVWALIQFFCG